MSKFSSNLIASLALLLLIGAPLGSYFYLNSGYNYRKDTLEELKAKGQIQSFNIVLDTVRQLQEANLKGKVTVLSHVNGSEESESFLADLYDQFSERDEFQIWSFSNNGKASESLSWQRINGPSAGSNALLDEMTNGIFELKSPYHILVDTAMQIRNFYDGSDPASLTKLVEHIAIVLPRTKKSEIVHKNLIDAK